MPVSKAQQKAVTKYVKAKYDRFGLTMAKGHLDEIKAHAEAQGQSVNGFINAAIDEKMEKPPISPVDAPNLNERAGEGILTPSTLIAAQEAAEAAGESVPQFLDRAVTTQAKRDKTSLQLGINPATGGTLEKEA